MVRFLSVAMCVVFCFILGCDLTPGADQKFNVEMQVTLEQNEEEFSPQGYTATYSHVALVTLGGLTISSDIRNTLWQGYESCPGPSWFIEWESEIDFDDVGYDEPWLTIVERNGKAWFLYAPALEFGIEHIGSPKCGGGDGIPSGTWVTKYFFYEDLSDGADPKGDFPVYYYDNDTATGGFVLATIPLETLKSNQTLNFTINYEATELDFSIALRVDFSVTPQ